MADFHDLLADFVSAIEACQDRVNPDVLARCRRFVDRVSQRVSLAQDVTVIAIAGATGSGKSSLFNALTRTALAQPGVQRPMTRTAMAATFGDHDTAALLDWLGVTKRHVLPGGKLKGIVLIDMVDMDSVALAHQEEVDRILEAVDEIFWVVDPQKYADATLHDRYLRRFSGHQAVMTFVLNQMDRLSAREAADVRQDFIRLLQADGITQPSVCQVSAVTGLGMNALRRRAAEVVKAKQSVVARLRADMVAVARSLRKQLRPSPAGPLSKANLNTLTKACASAAGIDQVSEAVLVSVRRNGAAATGWPILAWVARMKADPLKRLHLDHLKSMALSVGEPKDDEPCGSTRIHPIASARIESAVRALRGEAAAKLPTAWNDPLDRVLRERSPMLPDGIDRAIMSCDLDLDQKSRWWKVIRVFQWIILAVSAFGLAWLLTGLSGSPGQIPLPGWILLGGVGAGLLLAGISWIAVRVSSRRAAREVTDVLTKAIEGLLVEEIIGPINTELCRHDEAITALNRVIEHASTP